MAADALFGRDGWARVGQELLQRAPEDLRGAAKAWWDEYQDTIINAPRADIARIAVLLEAGQTYTAKKILARQMSREEMMAYQARSLDNLRSIAQRRVEIMDALEVLGMSVARVLGGLILEVLL